MEIWEGLLVPGWGWDLLVTPERPPHLREELASDTSRLWAGSHNPSARPVTLLPCWGMAVCPHCPQDCPQDREVPCALLLSQPQASRRLYSARAEDFFTPSQIRAA